MHFAPRPTTYIYTLDRKLDMASQIQMEVVLFELSNFVSTAATALLLWRFYKGSSTRKISDSFLACLTVACSIRCLWCAVWTQETGERMVVLIDALLSATLASGALALRLRSSRDDAAPNQDSSTPTPLCLRPELILTACLVSAYLLNPGENEAEYFSQTLVTWACYLEAVGLAPQLWQLLQSDSKSSAEADEAFPVLPGFATGFLASKLLRACFWAYQFYTQNMHCLYCLFAADCLGMLLSFAIFNFGVVRPWLKRSQSMADGPLLDIGVEMYQKVPASMATFCV